LGVTFLEKYAGHHKFKMAAIFFKMAAILAYKLHTLPLNLISLTDLGDIGGKK